MPVSMCFCASADQAVWPVQSPEQVILVRDDRVVLRVQALEDLVAFARRGYACRSTQCAEPRLRAAQHRVERDALHDAVQVLLSRLLLILGMTALSAPCRPGLITRACGWPHSIPESIRRSRAASLNRAAAHSSVWSAQYGRAVLSSSVPPEVVDYLAVFFMMGSEHEQRQALGAGLERALDRRRDPNRIERAHIDNLFVKAHTSTT